MAATLFQMMVENGFNGLSKVRENENGYPFVTLLNSNDIDNPYNIYFGKDASDEVNIDERIDPKEVFVYETTNEEGELRLKLSFKEGDAIATLEGKGYEFFSEVASVARQSAPSFNVQSFEVKQKAVLTTLAERLAKKRAEEKPVTEPVENTSRRNREKVTK